MRARPIALALLLGAAGPALAGSPDAPSSPTAPASAGGAPDDGATGITESDWKRLTEARAARVLDAWPKVRAWIEKYRGRVEALDRAARTGRVSTAATAAWAEVSRVLPDQETLSRVIGMPITEFWAGQAMLVAAWSQLLVSESFRQARTEAAAQHEELRRMAEDPALPADQRQALRQQLAELEQSLAAIEKGGPAIPQHAIAIARKFRDRIKSLAEWSPAARE
jgi:hypothetical protein